MKVTPIYIFYSLQIYTINISRELYKINQRHKTCTYQLLRISGFCTNESYHLSIPTAASAKQALR